LPIEIRLGELTALPQRELRVPQTPKLDLRGPTSKRREGDGREREKREGRGWLGLKPKAPP